MLASSGHHVLALAPTPHAEPVSGWPLKLAGIAVVTASCAYLPLAFEVGRGRAGVGTLVAIWMGVRLFQLRYEAYRLVSVVTAIFAVGSLLAFWAAPQGPHPLLVGWLVGFGCCVAYAERYRARIPWTDPE